MRPIELKKVGLNKVYSDQHLDVYSLEADFFPFMEAMGLNIHNLFIK